MLTVAELTQRCIELGILDADADAKWNGMALVTDDAWYSELSPKQFPGRIVRATKIEGQELVEVFDDDGYHQRLDDSDNLSESV
jgi:hypothetical protein